MSPETDSDSEENASLPSKSEAANTLESSNVDSQISNSENNPLTSCSDSKTLSPKSPCNRLLSNSDDSTFPDTTNITESNKRQGDFSSDDMQKNKKAKIDPEVKATTNSVEGSNTDSPSNTKSVSDAENADKIVSNQENIDEDDLILNCHLQFIKGNGKIFVKMNCAPGYDRNTMYQVFQLVKNKIN